MPFKLTKIENATRDKLVTDLTIVEKRLADAIEAYNTSLEEKQGAVQDMLDAYNGILEEARDFAASIAEQAEADIADKSDTWQEGEKGQAANAWKDEWEALELTEIEIDFPEQLDIDLEAVALLEDAPSEAE